MKFLTLFFYFFCLGPTNANQFLIDLEALYYFAQNNWHMHRHLHTYVGATLIAGISIAIGRPICHWLLKKWNSHLSCEQKKWLYVAPTISIRSAVTGAVLGAYSHIMLDSIMHSDIKPLLPFTGKNGLYGIITLNQLDLFCLASGIFGLFIIAALGLLRKRRKAGLSSDGGNTS